MAIITGTSGVNILNGTADADTISGLAGNDTLNGDAGDDTLDGGTGSDVLHGGDGTDTAWYTADSNRFIIYRTTANTVTVRDMADTTATGFGTDVLYDDVEFIRFNDVTLNIAALNLQVGGPGWGTVVYNGTAAANVANGTVAADVMYGGDGNDQLNGPSTGTLGDDTLYGENGNDILWGGGGNDTLDGGEGNDSLYGHDGDDVLNAGRGNDLVDGGNGNDTLIYAADSSRFIIYRTGPSTVVIRDMSDTSATGFGTDTVYDNVETVQFNDITLNMSTLGLVQNGAGWGSVTFNGTAGNDGIAGTVAADVMYGGDGNDFLNGSSGTAGNDTLYGQGGNDTLNGGDGDDTLDGGDGNDTLRGHAGNDTLLGGAGADFLEGGDGNDYLNGGADIDMVNYSTAASGVTVNLSTVTAQNTGGAGTDTLIGIENITGSNHADTLTGDNNANRLLGGSGDDILRGGDGADTLEGGVGDDNLYGENGDDTINGGAGNDYIDGGSGTNTVSYSQSAGGVTVDLRTTTAQDTVGAGVDTLANIQNVIGSAQADILTGTDLANRLNGAVGADTLFGLGGNDHLEGGSNHDTLYGGDGDDTLDGGLHDDLIDGGAGNDYASYASASAGVTVNLSIAGAQDTVNAGIDTLVSIENLRGSNFNDTLIGNAGENVFIGGDGDDYIDGGDGLDSISYAESQTGVTVNLETGVVIAPASGNDTLISIEGIVGSAFNDTLIGNAANNILDGGLGNDYLDGGDGIDTVNYSGATTTLYINLGTSAAQNVGVYGTDRLIDIENVRAGSGDDTILGSDGDNVIDGGGGINTISYANAFDGVTVDLSITTAQDTDGAGTDTLIGFTHLIGSVYDDTLRGNADNNTINGGNGSDTVILSGRWVDYDITYAAGAYHLNDRRSLDGADTYLSIEHFQFSDQTISPLVPADMLNDAPTDLNLVYNTVLQSAPDNYLVSEIDVTDADTGDIFVYEITGGAHASSFYITDDRLYVAPGGLTGYNAGDILTLNLRVTDAAGTSFAKTVQIEVVSNLLTGTSGNDNLIGTTGSDSINALAGNDIVQGLLGNDILDGGIGTDTVSFVQASGRVVVDLRETGPQDTVSDGVDTIINFENITGSNYDDTLIGNAGVNVINGGDGDDTIAGLGGNDTLNGGNGSDTVDYSEAASAVTVSLRTTAAQNTGGAGSDRLSNFENIIGSAYNDIFTQSNGDNVIDGGSGFDRVSYAGTATGVTVNLSIAGPQNTGAAGTDTLINIDALTGSSYNDTFTGTNGNNLLQGGSGTDTLEGLGGDDTLDGGSGTDTASYANATSGVTVNLSITGAQNTVGAGTDTLIAIERLLGSAHADTLIGNTGTNLLTGGAGNDFLEGGAGTDTLIGGDGIDTAAYTTATSRVNISLLLTGNQTTGGAGTDRLTEIENLLGSTFDDTLEGNAGDNVLDGGDGYDQLRFARHTVGVTVDLSQAGPQNTGGSGTDTYLNFEALYGSNYNDTLTGNAGDNQMWGASGNDVIFGGDGNDTIDGGAGNDTIDGGAGNDVLNGSTNTDTLSYDTATAGVTVSLAITAAQNTGGAGTDTVSNFENLQGSGFNDTLTGSTATNTIWGGVGNDVIFGGDGNDVLYGGAGADTLDGGAGTDWARYDDDIAGVTVNLATGTGLGGLAQGDVLTGIEYVFGGSGNDTLIGNASVNRLEGGSGNDSLNGGSGNDVLLGGDGNDILEGGIGTDTLNGGAGADIFVFTPASGADVVQDFTRGNFGGGLGDALDISDILIGFTVGVSNINDFVSLTVSGSNTTLRVDANGAVGGSSFSSIATLQGITGLTVNDLYTDGQIIVT